MELDQLLFKKIFDYFNKRRGSEPENSAHAVALEEVNSRFIILSRALCGEPIEIFSSEREGGWKDNIFFLPKEVSLFDSPERNIQFYIFRIFYLSIQKELKLNWTHLESRSNTESQQQAIETSNIVLQKLFEEFPLLKGIHDELLGELTSIKEDQEQSEYPDMSFFYGRWMKNSEFYDKKEALKNVGNTSFKANSVKPKTEMKARQADEVEVLTIDKKAQEDYTLTHNFEKVETIDEFNGVWRDFDGDDSLKEDSEALSDYNLKHMVRVDDPVHSVYQAEFSGNATIAESAEKNDEKFHYTYPEWDYSKREYKSEYCKVFPIQLKDTKPDYYKKTMVHNRSVLLKLRKIFARLNNDYEQVRRQTSGEHIDIDAVTDMFADIKAKHTPDDKVYFTKRKRKKELSLLFLLDLSLSSDGYAKGNRIIDIEKQVSILFGEVLNEYFVDFQIDGFYSKTRNNTSYITLKSFDEPWQKAKLKIGAVQPQGYTRIGPALRHASALLKKRDMRKKWLILLSDGKPNDYDRYEGQYGIQDIKQALREMKGDSINNYAVAIEEQAKYYLPQMFGNNHYNILSSPVEMINSLTKLYKRIEFH